MEVETKKCNVILKILYVDSSIDSEEIDTEINDKYSLFIARTGRDALSILCQIPSICVIVVSQKLDDMSGVELICRAKEFFPRIQSVFLTRSNNARTLYWLKTEHNINIVVRIPMEKEKLFPSIKETIDRLSVEFTDGSILKNNTSN